MAIAMALGLLMVRPLIFPSDGATSVSWGTFKRQLVRENVLRVTFEGPEVRGDFRTPVEVREGLDTIAVLEFITTIPEAADPELRELVWNSRAEVSGRPDFSGTSMGWTGLPILASLALVVLVILLLESRRRQVGR